MNLKYHSLYDSDNHEKNNFYNHIILLQFNFDIHLLNKTANTFM